jgi:uncharacterized membrane-anchored protein YhcB (DUF1043 family)
LRRSYGGIHLKQNKVQTELAQIDRDLKLLKRQVAHRERRAELLKQIPNDRFFR